MLKLSSIIIAKDEEVNIRKCIESQLSCIDDIVVIVDDKSSDATLAIVTEYPQINVEVKKWLGYSKTKQYAISLTKNDWVFWIDADEVITADLQKELLELKKSNTEYEAYSVARRAYFLGKWIKHSGWYPGRVVRLFNKQNAVFAEKDVHEHLVVKGSIGKLNSDLEHYTDPDIHHYFEKFNRYTSLAAEELFKKNRKAKITDLLFRPIFLFKKMYLFRLGFLDGIYGFVLAVLSSFYVFTKYAKLFELNRKADKNL